MGAQPAPCRSGRLGAALTAAVSCTTEEQMSSPPLFSSVQKYPKPRVICISFIHLEGLIPLLDNCHNAVLPGSGTTRGVLLCSEYQLLQVLMQQSLPQMMQ